MELAPTSAREDFPARLPITEPRSKGDVTKPHQHLESGMKNLIFVGAATLLLAACSASGAGGGATTTPTGAVPAGTSGSLINVNLSDIRAEIAKNVNVNLDDVPITVQLPITAAANVCGVDVNLLSAQLGGGNNTCTAVTTSPTLEQTVTNQM